MHKQMSYMYLAVGARGGGGGGGGRCHHRGADIAETYI